MEDNLGQIEFKISRSYIKGILIAAIVITSIVFYLVGFHSKMLLLEKMLLCLLPILGFGIHLLNLLKYKVVVNNKTISINSLFNNQSVRLGLLGNYSHQKEGIVIQTTYNQDFTISPPLEQQELFLRWLSHYSQNPEGEKEFQLQIAAEEELQNNKQFGKNTVELAENLKKASYVTYILHGVAIVNLLFLFYSIFFSKHSPYPILISILIPFLCLFVLYYFKGLIVVGLNPEKLRIYPNIITPLSIGILGSLYPLLSDTYLFDNTQLLVYDLLLAIVSTFLFLLITKEIDFKNIKDTLFAIVILMSGSLIYGYGTLSFLNQYKDTSTLQEFRAEVIEKRVTNKKDAIYYISLSSWHQNISTDEIQVQKSFYKSIAEKDSISILLSQGNLGIEWYWLEK